LIVNDETQTNPFPPDKLFVAPPGHNDISGTTLGNYKLVRKIAQGGMGVIYEAIQINLDRKVALKVLTTELATRPEFLARFEREAKSAAALNHPNIVAVHDFGEADGRRYIIMEFIDGENLSEYISKRGKIPVENALAIVGQAAHALKAAAEKSIIHRDIKPSNLMLTRDGRVKVADMGLAKILTQDSELTMSSVSIGSPHFIAPEQAGDSKNADHRVDIYSLGVTLLYLVTGKHAFDGDSPISVVLAHATKPLPTGADLGTELPAEVETFIRRMTEKDPANRYQDYDSLLADLQLVQRGYLPMSAPQPELPQKNSKKKLAMAIAIGVIFLAAISSTIFFASKKSSQQIKTVAVNSTPAATPVVSTAPAAVAPPSQTTPPENNFQPQQQQPDNFQPPDEQPPDQQNPPGGNGRPRFPMPMGPPPRMAPAPVQNSVVADTIKQYEAKMNAQLAGKNWQGAYDVWTNFPSNFRSRETDQQIMALLVANLPRDFHPRPPAGFRPAGRPPNQP
jgi:serine/threonine protein kinase